MAWPFHPCVGSSYQATSSGLGRFRPWMSRWRSAVESLIYADNLILIARNAYHIQRMLQQLQEALAIGGLSADPEFRINSSISTTPKPLRWMPRPSFSHEATLPPPAWLILCDSTRKARWLWSSRPLLGNLSPFKFTCCLSCFGCVRPGFLPRNYVPSSVDSARTRRFMLPSLTLVVRDLLRKHKRPHADVLFLTRLRRWEGHTSRGDAFINHLLYFRDTR